jgi:hypothetical protein
MFSFTVSHYTVVTVKNAVFWVVVLAGTNISEERVASIFRIKNTLARKVLDVY